MQHIQLSSKLCEVKTKIFSIALSADQISFALSILSLTFRNYEDRFAIKGITYSWQIWSILGMWSTILKSSWEIFQLWSLKGRDNILKAAVSNQFVWNFLGHQIDMHYWICETFSGCLMPNLTWVPTSIIIFRLISTKVQRNLKWKSLASTSRNNVSFFVITRSSLHVLSNSNWILVIAALLSLLSALVRSLCNLSCKKHVQFLNIYQHFWSL